MSRMRVGVGIGGGRFPRVSGDEPGMEPFRDCMAVFSPRERG